LSVSGETDVSRVLVVFARYPQPGRAKTRLIGPLSAETAAEVQKRCLDVTLACVDAVADIRRVVAVTPDDADFSAWVDPGTDVLPQGGGNLGDRLSRVVDREFARGCRHLVIVGSDCPTMSPQDLAEAFELLAAHDLVVGPAVDGGYYLIGLSRPAPAIFASIAWGSAHVADQTRQRAREAGLSVAELPVRRDVDTYDDIVAIVSEIPTGDVRLAAFKQFLLGLLLNGEQRGCERGPIAPEPDSGGRG
jgi:hypothetical protein